MGLSLLSLLQSTYLKWVKPLEQEDDNKKVFWCEFFINIVALITLIYAVDDEIHYFSEENRIFIGWFVIGICSLLILL